MTKMTNTYYCTECENDCGVDETCRECGRPADVELCAICRESIENCDCEDDSDCSPAGPIS
jgi:hypothetical protein